MYPSTLGGRCRGIINFWVRVTRDEAGSINLLRREGLGIPGQAGDGGAGVCVCVCVCERERERERDLSETYEFP